jgi:DNA-directed RNA polymerase II subunit RPB2
VCVVTHDTMKQGANALWSEVETEMERDCVVAHGMAEFTKERLMECSDQFSCYSCKDCGLMAVVNPEKGIWSCRGCNNTTNFAHIHVPYATKLLLQELETMSIASRMITQQKLITHQ